MTRNLGKLRLKIRKDVNNSKLLAEKNAINLLLKRQ